MGGSFVSAYDRVRKEWHHFSPSLLEAFSNCERVPYYDKILKLPKPPYDVQILGTKMHAQLEHLALTGQDLLEDRLKPLRKYLPEVLPHALIVPELGLDGKRKAHGVPYDYARAPKLAGRPVEGYIDLADWRVDSLGPGDYKTSSDPRKWGKTPDQLRKNLQLGVYARWMLEEYERQTGRMLEKVHARHLYAQTKGEVWGGEVAVTLSLADIEETWANAELLAQGLVSIEKAESDADIRPTGQAKGYCHAYNRQCPYMATCIKNPAAMLRARINLSRAQDESRNQKSPGESNTVDNGKAENVNLVARIKQAAQGGTQQPQAQPQGNVAIVATPAAAQPGTPAVEGRKPETAVFPSDGPGWKECLCRCCGESVGKRPPDHVVTAHDGCKNPGGSYQTTPAGDRVLLSAAGQVVGFVQAAPQVVSTASTVQASRDPRFNVDTPPEPPTPEEIARARAKNQGIVPPDAPKDDPNFQPEEKKKRGRKAPTAVTAQAVSIAPTDQGPAAGAQISKPQEQGTAVQTAAKGGEAPAATESPAHPAGQPATAAGKLPLRLFVNCIPFGEAYEMLDPYAAWAASEISKARQVLDFRLSDRGAVEGKGAIAALCRQEPPKAGTYVAITGGWDSALTTVVDALAPLAAFVVKGVR